MNKPGTITAVTPAKHGADRAFLDALVYSLSRNRKVTSWAVAAHPDDAEYCAQLGAKYGLETLVAEEWGTNVAALRNSLLSFVSTRYWVQADADDLYCTLALDDMASLIDIRPGAGLGGAFGLCTDFDTDTNETLFRTPKELLMFHRGIAKPGQLAQQRARTLDRFPFPVAPYCVHPGAGVFTTDSLDVTHGYPEEDGGNFWDDVVHLGRVNQHFPVFLSPETAVLNYRKHPGAATAKPTRRMWRNVARRLQLTEQGVSK